MSVFDTQKETLEKHELMMGRARGRLAVSMDLLTDALLLVGQHGVYCQSARTPGTPKLDIRMITQGIAEAKELVASVMEELRQSRAARTS